MAVLIKMAMELLIMLINVQTLQVHQNTRDALFRIQITMELTTKLTVAHLLQDRPNTLDVLFQTATAMVSEI